MVKYYYDKYNSVANNKYGEPSFGGATNRDKAFKDLYTSYTWDGVAKTFSTSGEKFISYEVAPVGTVGYLVEGGLLAKYTKLSDNASSSNASLVLCMYQLANPANAPIIETTYSKGTLVQSNIVAENGTYPTDGRHTDGFWYTRKGVVNQNPAIAPVGTVPSGSMEVKPSFAYKVTDPDGNAMTVTESIDGITFNTRTGVVSGTQLTFTPTDLVWLRTRIKQIVNITITANDGNGGVTTVNYPITRTTPAIDLGLKTPFETNVAARRLLLKLEGNIPTGTKVDVQVCNNAFDVSPTWENATNLVLSGFPHPFTNKTKTATKWGVSFKVKIERGTAVDAVYLDGLGGAFD